MEERKIDILIAEKVMEFQPFYDDGVLISFESEFGSLLFTDDEEREWKPSTDIADAWLVVEKLEARFTSVEIHLEKGMTNVVVTEHFENGYLKNTHQGYEKSAPLSICYAALKSIGLEV